MANQIYTIGREFGSGGQYVGEELAKRLGIKLYDKELLQQAAKDLASHSVLANLKL